MKNGCDQGIQRGDIDDELGWVRRIS